MSQAQIRSEIILWSKTVLFGFVICILVNIYIFIIGGDFDLHVFNKSLAGTAVWLIGFSFALSGLCYFWNFVDSKIIYRKFLGIVGFGFGILHAYISLIFYLEKSIYPGSNFDLFYKWHFFNFTVSNLVAFFSAIAAVLIFGFMTIISNRYATMELGGQRWRILLRIGYIAYVFILIHFAIKNYENWTNWFKSDLSLPPHNMILSLFILCVLLLRVALFISIRLHVARSNSM